MYRYGIGKIIASKKLSINIRYNTMYRYQIGKMIFIKKIKYCIVLFKIWNIYKIDLIATWTSLHKGSLQFIRKIYKAESAKFDKLCLWEASSIVKYC